MSFRGLFIEIIQPPKCTIPCYNHLNAQFHAVTISADSAKIHSKPIDLPHKTKETEALNFLILFVKVHMQRSRLPNVNSIHLNKQTYLFSSKQYSTVYYRSQRLTGLDKGFLIKLHELRFITINK